MHSHIPEDYSIYLPLARRLTQLASATIAYQMFFGKEPTKEELEAFMNSHRNWTGQFVSNDLLKNPFYRFALFLWRKFGDRD